MSQPIRLGILTDIQYASKEDAFIEYIDKIRHYSRVLPKTKLAIEQLNKQSVELVLHLGDIIDGNDTIAATKADLQATLKLLSESNTPVRHVLGNHCLSAGRDFLVSQLGLDNGYYHIDFRHWRIVVLDTVDISVDREEPYHTQAVKYLETHKGEPNANDWNGGLSTEQLSWLKQVLDFGGNVLVCGHLPIFCNGTEQHVLWGAQQAHDLFIQYRVKAYFAGHFHQGDYVQRDGIHYVTFESILDSVSDQGSYGVVELYDHTINIRGYGDMKSLTLQF